jgi:hypothetical protein
MLMNSSFVPHAGQSGVMRPTLIEAARRSSLPLEGLLNNL